MKGKVNAKQTRFSEIYNSLVFKMSPVKLIISDSDILLFEQYASLIQLVENPNNKKLGYNLHGLDNFYSLILEGHRLLMLNGKAQWNSIELKFLNSVERYLLQLIYLIRRCDINNLHRDELETFLNTEIDHFYLRELKYISALIISMMESRIHCSKSNNLLTECLASIEIHSESLAATILCIASPSSSSNIATIEWYQNTKKECLDIDTRIAAHVNSIAEHIAKSI